MSSDFITKLFRDETGEIMQAFNPIQGLNFASNPLDIFIVLARYKFAARHIKKNHIVADVGVGQGIGGVLLADSASKVVGLDVDQALIDSCRQFNKEKGNIEYRQYDLLNPEKLLDGMFDVVVSHDVIEHFPVERVPAVIESYHRLLKPKGFAIIGTPNIESKPYASQRRIFTHEHEFSHQEFRDSLEKRFRNVFLFGMNDEIVSTQFLPMAWYLIAICTA